MDDTKTADQSAISLQPSAEEEVVPAATDEAVNPFSALKEFDVELKEEPKGAEASEEEEKLKEDASPKTQEESISAVGDAERASSRRTPAGNEVTEDIRRDTEAAGPTSDKDQQPQEETEMIEEKPEPPLNPNAKWYVVHTFAGHENKVATALKQRIEAERLENLIYDILVPTQDKIEIRGGKKETVKEKIFPGYILIKMELSDASWLAVRTTQGVTSFIGAGNKPTPISDAEVATIVKFTTQGAQPTFKDVFMVDDTVKIIDGPFAEFIGKVDSVDKEKGRVRVLVSIFGRETPVELDFLQVQKL